MITGSASLLIYQAIQWWWRISILGDGSFYVIGLWGRFKEQRAFLEWPITLFSTAEPYFIYFKLFFLVAFALHCLQAFRDFLWPKLRLLFVYRITNFATMSKVNTRQFTLTKGLRRLSNQLIATKTKPKNNFGRREVKVSWIKWNATRAPLLPQISGDIPRLCRKFGHIFYSHEFIIAWLTPQIRFVMGKEEKPKKSGDSYIK